MSTIETIFLPGFKILLNYGMNLAQDIPEEKFARKPQFNNQVINMMHPAFAYGHLATYPKKILTLLELKNDNLKVPEDYYKIFEKGQVCHDDLEANIYPSKNEILENFRYSMQVVAESLSQADITVFDKVNPFPAAIDRFPTVGAFVSYLLSAHISGHLGQISSWRRSQGLGAV
jgi:hypothetical protein